jgi:hypothetical protein
VLDLAEKREGPENPYGVVWTGAMRTSENFYSTHSGE